MATCSKTSRRDAGPLMTRPILSSLLSYGLLMAGACLILAAGFSAQTPAQEAGGESFECLVEPYQHVEISSGVPGILEEVSVERGDLVSKGDVLAKLRSNVERAAFELAAARTEFAMRRVERNKELYRKQMTSIHEKDELETEAQLLRLEMKEAEERLNRRVIRSPLTGVVVKRHSSPGEYVQDDVILELAQIDPVRVEVAVPVRYYGKITVGMQAQVQWESPVPGLHQAKVKVVDRVLDAASGTIGVRLELPNPDLSLPTGTKCRVSFPIEKTATAD
jgi:membrane fusion protein (multidrug efflux system)